MTIQQRIDEDLKTAMKARDQLRLSVLRMLKTALKNAAIEKGGADAALDDPEAVAVIRKLAKQREDSIASFEKGGRPELAAKERDELGVLSAYLPQPLSEAEIDAIILEAIAQAGGKDPSKMGAVMKIATAKAAGRADGRTLSAAAKKHLGG